MTRRGPAWAEVLAVTFGLLLLGGCGTREDRAPDFDPEAIPEGYRETSAALMWPGATRSFRVTPAGDLDNGAWRVRITPSSAGEIAGPPRVIATRDRWLPVVRWTRRTGGIRWRFEAVAVPAEAPGDTSLLVSLSVRAYNEGATPLEAKLDLRFDADRGGEKWFAYDAAPGGSPLRWAYSRAGEHAVGWAEPEWAALSDSACAIDTTLGPAESREMRALLSTYPAEPAVLARAARATHARMVKTASRHWLDALGGATRFELGDPDVESALSAARVVLLSLCEKRGDAWLPIGSPFQYHDVWLRDGARAVYALSVAGHTDIARSLASGLMLYQWPNGAFLSQRGQLDGTGQALWALEQAYLVPEPAPSLAPACAAARRAITWCERQRALGREANRPYGTMLPFGDPRDGELLSAQLVGNDAWAMRGYTAAARLLRAAGETAEADTIAAARRRYAEDFMDALARRGHDDVPPAWQRGGLDWGNASVAWPCDALPARHPRTLALARRMWAEAGGAGLVSYGSADSAHFYLGVDLAVAMLVAGHRASVDSVLGDMLAWRSASGYTGEIFSRSTRSYGDNLLPHSTGSAAVVTLIRNALIEDQGDTLRLTLGARERWWRGSRVLRAPTRWGLLDLRFERQGDQATWTWDAVPVWTRLTPPPGTRIVEAPAGVVVTPDGGAALAPPGSPKVRVRVRTAAS